MVTSARKLTDQGDVLALPWSKFVPWFQQRWRPGDHVALIGPTNSGKSTLAVAILPLRRFVLALDPKGGDSTLARLQKAGFERVTAWPLPKKYLKALEDDQPVRLIVGPVVKVREDRDRLRAVLAATLRGAFDMGGWTVYVDELQVAADKRMMGLGPSVEENMIAARDKGLTMVCSYQRPANVPRAAADQATWLAIWYTRDVDVVNRLAEMTGRPKAEIRGAVRGLERNAILLFSMDPNEPIVVTRAPRA